MTVLLNRSRLLLRALAPWMAVLVCWCVFRSGWLAILAYHAQVLAWHFAGRPQVERRSPGRRLLLALPCLLGGPLAFVLFPYLCRVPLLEWLSAYGVSGTGFLLMIPYFGLLHPSIEQLHWRDIWAREGLGWYGWVLFSGYHALVLHSLFSWPWLIVCFVLLIAVAGFWSWLHRLPGGFWIAVASHVLADLGIIVAAAVYAGIFFNVSP